MKKLVFILMAMLSGRLYAQSDSYNKSMQEYTVAYDSAKTLHDYQKLSSAFIKIGDEEKTQWLPYYYAALVELNAGWMDKSNTDANAQKINSLLDQAGKLTTAGTDLSEIYVLREVSATQQMMVDPQNRYATFGQQAATDLEKAISYDASNPRIYYLQGMRAFNTPSQFGGGKDKAKPLFEKAVKLYGDSKYKLYYPKGGKKESVNMLANCD